MRTDAAAAMKTGEYVGYRKAINALRDPGKYVDKIGAPVDLAGHAFFAALLESIAEEVLAE